MKNKLFKVVLNVVFLFLILMNTFSYAKEISETDLSFQKYLGYIEEGILSAEVSYDQWRRLVIESYELEKNLSISNQFYEVYSSESSNNPGFVLQEGDILITNGASYAGIIGHSGIAIGSSNILHILKGGSPRDISLYEWCRNYNNKREGIYTKVYRHINKSVGREAAIWAINNYLGSDAFYFIDNDLWKTKYTYCSKLVWQAYFFGPEPAEAKDIIYGPIDPYELPDLIYDLKLEHIYE